MVARFRCWTLLFALAAIASCSAAPPPGQQYTAGGYARESYDRFTQETVWATRYGRLDNPQGCARDNIAIYWKVAHGRSGSTELVAYDWMMIDAPFSPKAEWLGAVEAGVSIDGDIVDATRHPSPSAWKIDGGSKTKSERGVFVLPPGTLRRVATAKAPVLRIAGTQRTCQGTIEPAMRARIQSMLASLGR